MGFSTVYMQHCEYHIYWIYMNYLLSYFLPFQLFFSFRRKINIFPIQVRQYKSTCTDWVKFQEKDLNTSWALCTEWPCAWMHALILTAIHKVHSKMLNFLFLTGKIIQLAKIIPLFLYYHELLWKYMYAWYARFTVCYIWKVTGAKWQYSF